jgi:hypothetical protein
VTIDELKHLILKAAQLTGESYIYVIGSNALLATLPEPSNTIFTRSREADIIPGSNDPKKADQIDFVLGELSSFDETFNYYAQGLTLETPLTAPAGWIERTIPLPVTREITGLCMEVHDLALSKYGAGREKDLEFNSALAREGIVQKPVLLERLALVECTDELRERMRQRIKADFRI